MEDNTYVMVSRLSSCPPVPTVPYRRLVLLMQVYMWSGASQRPRLSSWISLESICTYTQSMAGNSNKHNTCSLHWEMQL